MMKSISKLSENLTILMLSDALLSKINNEVIMTPALANTSITLNLTII